MSAAEAAHGGGEARPFVEVWRRRKSAAFALEHSTGGRTVRLDLWSTPAEVYANANLSIYSGQSCNARCAFCVEEIRPASRGRALERPVETNDARYFAALDRVLTALARLDPSVSVTGGEPSKDPRLPAILRALARHGARKRTVTTNGSGLLDVREGRRVIDWITSSGVRHLNISVAHPDAGRNAKLMGYAGAPGLEAIREIAELAKAGGARVRLSCALISGAIDDLAGVHAYLDFARRAGVDNVIFRQLMRTDPRTAAPGGVVRFSDRHRVALEPILDAIGAGGEFEFQRQIVGYYYYVEVWRAGGIDVVFEEADLAQLERARAARPDLIQELVFHPGGTLNSTWQPWDGVLGP